ncbi:response regulator [Mucilaginibacter arboris]|uniref:Response regulator n=1 Tax=Mucilaginibacter arboris TaxID=2682090 RepID=A0A7K1SW13_9SPHI|nr:response regulator [Mucilaginibacter arboris]MVN21515.1 response regulator [Mucilaginibacter arboris]
MPLLKTIAVVDDDPIYINALKNLLSSWQVANPFLFFTSGKEALDFLLVKEALALPDVLLLDLNMPLMNGWKFLENLEPVLPQLQKKINIYLVSSSIWEEDLKRAKKNKLIKEFITKPVFKEKLLEILG